MKIMLGMVVAVSLLLLLISVSRANNRRRIRGDNRVVPGNDGAGGSIAYGGYDQTSYGHGQDHSDCSTGDGAGDGGASCDAGGGDGGGGGGGD